MNSTIARSCARIFALVVGAAAATAVAQTPAHATSPYPPGQFCVLAAHPDNAQPGETVTLTGSGFGANTSVVIELNPPPIVLGSTTSDSTGAFSIMATIPADTTGTHTLTANGIFCGSVSSSNIENPPPPPPSSTTPPPPGNTRTSTSSGGGLAATGASVWVPAGLAAMLLAVGLGLSRAARSRRARRLL
jgi:hypothetical protein